MILKAYDIKKINAKLFSKTENRKLLEEFIDSNLACAKVECFPQKNSKVCTSSLNNSIKTYHMLGIKAIERKGQVFLIKF